VPEIFADEHPKTAKTGVEGPYRITRGEEAAFVKQTIGWQINLVMNMNDLALGKVRRSDKEPVSGVFVHKADHHVNIPAGIEEMLKEWIIGPGPAGDGWHEVLKHVTGQGEFRENQ